MNSIKKILILTLFSAISATPNYRYMLSYYAIEADKSGQMSATECQTMLQQSIYYNIISDKPVFREDKDALYKILNYNRLITTELNDHQTLYTGEYSVELIHQGKPIKTTETVSFVHDSHQKLIRGHMRIPGYCQASLFGLDTSASS